MNQEEESACPFDRALSALCCRLDDRRRINAFVKKQSDVIKTSLEQESLTQTGMNQKAEKLRALWNEALNHLPADAKKILPEAEVEKPTAEMIGSETAGRTKG